MSGHHRLEISSVPYEDIKININQTSQTQQQPLAGVISSPSAASASSDSVRQFGQTLSAGMQEEGKQTRIYVFAGAAAGIMEHCVMYPVDSIKTRMQSLRPHPKAVYSSVRQAFSQIVHTEGYLRPIRGMNIVALGAGPSHALYFASYELTKKYLGKTSLGQSHFANAAAGTVATFFHDGTMNPVEVIKQRVQMYGSPYRGVFDCARCILKTEGISAFYRSFTTQLTMNIPFQCIHFVTYEKLRELLNPVGGYNPKTHLLAGATAGGLAAALTTPLDVAKTLLNTQEESVVRDQLVKQKQSTKVSSNRLFVSGMVNALSTIYKIRGVPGYFQGLQARVIYQVPSCAISWSVYEFFKHYLSLNISEEEMIELTI